MRDKLPIETYQHVMPGMQADAARVYEALAKPVTTSPVERSGAPIVRDDYGRRHRQRFRATRYLRTLLI